jgi:hypothetical protein
MQNIPDAELNQLIMPFMWSNLKRKIVKVLPNTETPDPEVVFEAEKKQMMVK